MEAVPHVNESPLLGPGGPRRTPPRRPLLSCLVMRPARGGSACNPVLFLRWPSLHLRLFCTCPPLRAVALWLVLAWVWCYTEKATEARHCLERQYNACANRNYRSCKTQCRPNETKPYSNAPYPCIRQSNPTIVHTPSRIKSTHTRITYIGTRPHAPGHQAGDHPVPAHTERHKPSKVWTQRQAGSPP